MTQTILSAPGHAADQATLERLWGTLTPVFDDIFSTAPSRDAAGDLDRRRSRAPV